MAHIASTKELRHFGLLVGTVCSIIGLWPMLAHGLPVRIWALILGALLVGFGAACPRALAPAHRGWMWIGHVLGWINTRILLTIVFYLLITPIGVVCRWMGKKSMRPEFSNSSSTYRVLRQKRPSSHMKFQF